LAPIFRVVGLCLPFFSKNVEACSEIGRLVGLVNPKVYRRKLDWSWWVSRSTRLVREVVWLNRRMERMNFAGSCNGQLVIRRVLFLQALCDIARRTS
jgi:hypothetical protein